MGTGESLTASERVQRLQTALHAKAKEAPGFRFYSLSDKVWRDDVLAAAWQAVRRNGGAAGVDGETVADAESFGVDRWLGALARDLKAGTYRPRAVRQVLIPKKQRGKFRPLGIPCLRDRVAQTAAMLVLSPIFEADLQPEQYAYRPGRDAKDAVKRVHRLLNTGHREVVDADLTDYFGLLRSNPAHAPPAFFPRSTSTCTSSWSCATTTAARCRQSVASATAERQPAGSRRPRPAASGSRGAQPARTAGVSSPSTSPPFLCASEPARGGW